MPRGIYKRNNGKMGKLRKKVKSKNIRQPLPNKTANELNHPLMGEMGSAGPGKSELLNKLLDQPVTLSRANKQSSIFVDDCRVFIRNLTDVKLLNERGRIQVKLYDLRQSLEALDTISHEMWKELQFRELK